MQKNSFSVERIEKIEEIRQFVNIRDAFKDQENEILNMLVTSGAFLKGHFQLQSGQHSDIAFLFRDLAGRLVYLKRITDLLIREFKKDRVKFDGVLYDEEAGSQLGEMIARELGKRRLIIRTSEQHRLTRNLINEESLYRNDRILIVGNTATTSRILQFMVSLAWEKKARAVGVALFATRNKEAIREFESKERLKVYALADFVLTNRMWRKTDCPLCQENKPLLNFWEI